MIGGPSSFDPRAVIAQPGQELPRIEPEPLDELAKALAAAQGELEPPKRSRTVTVKTKDGGTYRYSYAELSDVIAALRAVFPKHGLAWVQPVASTDAHVTAQLVLLHASGQRLSFPPVTMPVARAGDAQSIGSAMTYARRYQLTAAFGIAAEDDDDARTVRAIEDAGGTAVAGSTADKSGKHSEAQMKKIHALGKQKGRTHERIRDWAGERYGTESLAELTKAAAADLIERLEALPDAPPPSPSDPEPEPEATSGE